MRPLDGLRDIFINALRAIPEEGYIGVKSMLIDKWNKEIDYLQKHYDFTYKKDSEEKRDDESRSN